MARRRSSRVRYMYPPVLPSRPMESTPAAWSRSSRRPRASVSTRPRASVGVIGKADNPRNGVIGNLRRLIQHQDSRKGRTENCPPTAEGWNVVYTSLAPDLVAGDGNAVVDVFVASRFDWLV